MSYKFELLSNKLNKQLKKLIEEDFKGEDHVCILLSGGSDSTLLSLILRDLGKRVTTVSYTLMGTSNWDEMKSKEISVKYLQGIHYDVRVSDKNSDETFLSMIRDYNCKTKVEVECVYPMVCMLNKIKEIGFDRVVTGFSNPLPDNRSSNVSFKENPKKYWENELKSKYDTIGTERCFEVGEKIGVTLLQYLNHPSIIKLLKEVKTIEDLNYPYPKHLWKSQYLREFEELGLLDNKSLNLQVGGQIESYFENLLSDPKINYKGYIRGNTTNRLSSLVQLWVNNPYPKEKPYPIITKFKPYTMKDVTKQSNKKLFTVVSTFSGGGGSSTGYKLGGGDVVLVNEIVPEAIETYKRNYPKTPIVSSDIRKITGSGGKDYVLKFFKEYGIEEGQFDILDGSPPCSTFSTSGSGEKKIEEKNVKYSDITQDRIGMLIHDFVFICNVMKPKICIIENVPSIKSSDVFKDSIRRLRKWGYKVNFDVMCSSNFGVPQRRNRLIVIGVRGDICKKVGIKSENDILKLYPKGSIYEPTVLDGLTGGDLNQKLQNDIRENEEIRYLRNLCRKSSTYELIKRIGKNPRKVTGMSDIDPNWTSDFNLQRLSWDKPSSTLTQMGQSGGRGGLHHPQDDRVFTVNELKRLMGLPDDFELTGSFSQRSERLCRMVTPNIYKYLSESLYEKIILPTKHIPSIKEEFSLKEPIKEYLSNRK